MSKLRDEIARAVARAVDRALDGERAMTPPPLGEWHPLVTDAADDIMTAVREALLSDEAVEKAEDAFAGRNPGMTWGNMFNAFVPAEDRARDAITAALDTVIGKGGGR